MNFQAQDKHYYVLYLVILISFITCIVLVLLGFIQPFSFVIDVNVNRFLKTLLWILVLLYLGVIDIYLFYKSRRKKLELKSQKIMYRAWMAFLFFYILHRAFFLLSDFESDLHGDSLWYYRYVTIAYISIIIGIWGLIFIVEKNALNLSKNIISYTIIIMLIVNTILFLVLIPEQMITIGKTIDSFLLYFEVLLLMTIYLYLAKNSKGKLKTKSLCSLLGLVVLADGLALDGVGIFPYNNLLSPFVFALGITIFVYAQLFIKKEIE